MERLFRTDELWLWIDRLYRGCRNIVNENEIIRCNWYVKINDKNEKEFKRDWLRRYID